MNYVLIAALLILAVNALIGWGRGLIKSVFSTFSLIVAVILAIQIMPYATKFLKTTPVYTTINESISQTLDENVQISMNGVSEQMSVIETMKIPEFIKDLLKTNNNADMYEALGISQFTDYISNYLTVLILNGISVIVCFLIIFIALRILGSFLDMMSRIPVVNGLNRIGGLAFGLLNGAAFLWLACIVVTIGAATSWGSYVFAQINDSVLLSFIYNNNYLLALLANMGKVLF